MKESTNIGVYICTGCGISDALDTGRLESVAGEYPSVKNCQVHSCLCSAQAHLKINDEINESGFDALVIAGCSHRHASGSFSFGEVYTERVNIRESVAWTMEPGHEDTLMAAEDYLRMGIARTMASGNPEPYLQELPQSDILVLGGGITGIHAALDASRAGYSVRIIEKEEQLGGWLNKWHDIIPASGGGQTHLDYFLKEKLEELNASERISVHTNTTVNSIEGEPGNFRVRLAGTPPTENAGTSKNDAFPEYGAGSVILANGWKPYDPAKLTKIGYSENNNIITAIELEAMQKEGQILRPSDGKVPENVVFLQCTGSRGKEHLPYCSNICCLTTLKQVSYIRQSHPETNIFIIYKDIRTPGRNEHFYRQVQEEKRVFFTKGKVAAVEKLGNDSLNLVVDNNPLGELMNIRADLLITATGMEPNQSEDLHLLYRKGEGLPDLKYGFPDSHFICFPYETQRTGIYAAGAVRTPQGIQGCMEDASGAVVKAIQCIESVKRGEAVHPRSGDRSYPDLYMQRCTDCKRCTEECPFGSYDETEKGTPLPNPARCRRCGICMGSCPERIINFDNYSINAVSSMIKAIPIPDEFKEKPRILAFVCENDAYPAFDIAALHRHRISPWLRIIPVRCIGSINKIWLSDALSAGFDGILQIGCKPGDDYQCHFITGSELMETRSENIQETLQTMMLEPERIETVFLEIDEYHKIPGIIEDYVETIEDIGPNPFKDM